MKINNSKIAKYVLPELFIVLITALFPCVYLEIFKRILICLQIHKTLRINNLIITGINNSVKSIQPKKVIYLTPR